MRSRVGAALVVSRVLEEGKEGRREGERKQGNVEGREERREGTRNRGSQEAREETGKEDRNR